MGPRKRLRASPSDTLPPPPGPSLSDPNAASSPPAEPTPVPSQENSTSSKNSEGPAASETAHSPTSSAAPSIDNRYASLNDSKTKTRSWYGSWPRVPKSSASTQVARETILGGTSKPNASPDFSRYEAQKPGDEDGDTLGVSGLTLSRESSTLTLGGAKGGKTSGSALKQASTQNSSSTSVNAPTAAAEAATPTITGTIKGKSSAEVNLGPPVGLPPLPGTRPKPESKATAIATAAAAAADAAIAAVSTSANTAKKAAVAPSQPSQPSQTSQTSPDAMDTAPDHATAPPQAAAPSQGWLSWMSRKEASEPKQTEHNAAPESTEAQAPKTEASQPHAPTPDAAKEPTTERPAASGGMWSYFWAGSGKTAPEAAAETKPSNSKPAPGDVAMEDAPSAPIPVPATSNASANTAGGVSNSPAAATTTATTTATATATASAGSTWAFWSRDTRKTTGKSPSSSEPGEMAVIGDRSEAHPTPAAGVKMSDQPSSKASSMKDVAIKDAASSMKSKRLRPKSMEIDDIALAPAPAGTPPPEAQAPGAAAPTTTAASKAAGPSDILLPSFRSTYQLKENPSILRQITRLLLPAQGHARPAHLFLAKEPPRVKKAVAIGVHGLFPASYLRPMIGQPTGTSIRFANHAAEATRRWADRHGCGDCEIEKIALEGEGKIADRVDNLWKLLLNWIDHIRGADLVVLACHSQGVPVGFMLLAKLIDLGIVTTARIGVCAMAGVSLGPFPDYKSGLGILMGSAGELWDFGNPDSEVSKRYAHALKTALDYGVRVAFVGSLDDQVVPLESAIHSPVHHPYVYRAVFVDGRSHAPDFIAHLIGFACKLRNLGVSDHGLVRELSVPLAGSLYSGEGHSRLYDDPQVYDLALAHTLETADLDSSTRASVTCEIKRHSGLTSPNPYVLPWIMRGLLEEDFVKTELHSETAELVRQFEEWKPVTKALKDVKYRLEAVQSKL